MILPNNYIYYEIWGKLSFYERSLYLFFSDMDRYENVKFGIYKNQDHKIEILNIDQYGQI